MVSLSVKMLQVPKWTTLFSKCCLWPRILQIRSFVYTVSSNRLAQAASWGRSRCESSGARMFSGHLLSEPAGVRRHKDGHRSTINAWIAGGYWAPCSASFVGQWLFFLVVDSDSRCFFNIKLERAAKAEPQKHKKQLWPSAWLQLCVKQTELSRLIMN